jgi:hypothetical protein
MKHYTALTLAVSSIFVFGLSAFSQSQISDNQPVKGELHARETEIQAKLKAAYNAGNIDSTELAQFQRDFDGILTRENDFRTRSTGLTDSGKETIAKQLDTFEARLNRHANKSNMTSKADPTKVDK